MSTMSIPQAMAMALQHHGRGELRQAEAIYRQVLQQQPDHPDALHLLGMVAHVAGQHEAARDLIERAIGAAPSAAHYRSNLGNVLRVLGRLPEAAECYRRAVSLQPAHVPFHNNLGIVLQEAGRVDEAIAVLRQALQLTPESAETLSLLGLALERAGRLDEAGECLERCIALRPGHAQAHVNLSVIRARQGRGEEAMQCCRRAIASSPGNSVAHFNLGNLLKQRRQLEDAINSYRQAISLHPGYAEAYGNLGGVLADQCRLDEAIACLREGVSRRPDHAALHGGLLYNLQFDPGCTPASLAEEHRLWAERHARPLLAQIRPHVNDRSCERTLRIGYVSGYLREHPIGRFLEALFANHERRQFHITCYSDAPRPDAQTERLRRHVDAWHQTGALDDAAMAELIRQDRIDILVDLNLHMGNRMLVFGRRPAPVQVTYLGYPASTGLPAMDYRLTDCHLDPPDGPMPPGPEKLVYLARSYYCDTPPEAATAVNDLPAMRNGAVTFGSFNNFIKVNDEVAELWSRVLAAVPGASLAVLVEGGEGNARARELFERHGVGRNRLKLLARTATMGDYFRLHHEADIALDPFPYGGHTTTLDALWMGVPVVTLAGERAVGRAGVSILSNLALADWIARTPEQYIQIAAGLAGDLRRLSEIRRTLRQRVAESALMDGHRFARGVEAAYRAMWRAWCEGARQR